VVNQSQMNELKVTMNKAPLNQNVNSQKKKVLNLVIFTQVDMIVF